MARGVAEARRAVVLLVEEVRQQQTRMLSQMAAQVSCMLWVVLEKQQLSPGLAIVL
jgi:hypothetical protein